MATLEGAIRESARGLGFGLVGIARATEADGFHRFEDWLAEGFCAEMHYLSANPESRRHPSSILAGVRSVVMVAMDYAEVAECSGQRHREVGNGAIIGKVARYAVAGDYHELVWDRLRKLITWLQTEAPGCRCRAVCDTAPLLERDFARRAGLGWIGKNTMLIHPERGSYFVLGALLTDLDLKPDAPFIADHCGTCTACLDACPTAAFSAPGRLDARKCISYHSIESRSPVPADLRAGFGDWLFGCDVCQEVCPWNRHDDSTPLSVDALEVLAMDHATYRERFRGTALTRAKHSGLRRNAALVLGNAGDERALPALEAAIRDPDPLVRDAAEWAMARITSRRA